MKDFSDSIQLVWDQTKQGSNGSTGAGLLPVIQTTGLEQVLFPVISRRRTAANAGTTKSLVSELILCLSLAQILGTILRLIFPKRMSFFNTTIRSGWLILMMTITACSSSVPVEIRQELSNAPSVAQLRNNPGAYIAQRVRWGGMILKTENKQNTSWLTVIAYPLSDSGVPLASARSPGRFIAIVNEFLDPLVFSRDRFITVKGDFFKTATLMVGEYPYLYPLIEVDHYYIWPEKQEPYYADYPPYWGYDPWYYPGYPWRYPHRHHLHRHY